MNKILLLGISLSVVLGVSAQQQISNGDMENWETTTDELAEPINWNSFQTASGTWSGFGGQQLDQSTDVRPGSSGTYSARIWTRYISFANTNANGNMTLGKIEMGSTTPSSSSNYNYTVTGDDAFSEALTDQPDSIVFWVKYTNSNASDQARMSAILHTDVNFKDPNDVGNANTTASAILNFDETGGEWIRKSVPFDYNAGSASTNNYILVTFTSNSTPGGGSADDEVLIDDVELIYNPSSASVENVNTSNATVYSSANQLHFNSVGSYEVYDLTGNLVQKGEMNKSVAFNQNKGVYFVKMSTESGVITKRVYIQ